MFSSQIGKRQTQPRVSLQLEELETRALLSSVQPLPIYETVPSTNWSGYAAETNLNSPASDAVTSVSGSWTVPTVSGRATGYSSVWVGIDGYSSFSVEQLGTEQDTSKTGATRFYAWYEMYPNPSVRISTMPISPGDSMSASVIYNGNNSFTLQMTDNTTGTSFSINQSASVQRSSAEWIVEAPSSGSVLPLANFGTVKFSAAQATISGHTGAIDDSSWQNTSINMTNKSGTAVIATTSGLTDSGGKSSFSVSFTGSGGGGGHGHGHGHFQPVAIVAPIQSDFQAPANPAVVPNATAEPQTSSAAQNLIVSASAADAWSPSSLVHDFGPTSGLKAWWDAMPPATTDEALPTLNLGSDELNESM
jgi:hypothetical protein